MDERRVAVPAFCLYLDMGYSAQQIEKGRMKQVAGSKSRKDYKKCQHRRMRRKIKANNDFVPQYNRYEGGWEL